MDILIGRGPAIGSPADRAPVQRGAVEAKLLAVRNPRRQRKGPPPPASERREAGAEPDPATGRVLVLLIPDGSRLPEGIEKGSYRVFLRFAKR